MGDILKDCVKGVQLSLLLWSLTVGQASVLAQNAKDEHLEDGGVACEELRIRRGWRQLLEVVSQSRFPSDACRRRAVGRLPQRWAAGPSL